MQKQKQLPLSNGKKQKEKNKEWRQNHMWQNINN